MQIDKEFWDGLVRKRDDMLYEYQAKNYESIKPITPRPPEATWADAKLYRCDFYDTRYPVCGTRLVWVVVGWKWVRLCTPVQHDKWRIRREEWDKIPQELFAKDEDDD